MNPCSEEEVPAPAPEMAMPPIKVFMVLAVLDTINPRHTSVAPRIATYRRPSKSDRLPTNGHIPARASKFARTYSACMLVVLIKVPTGTWWWRGKHIQTKSNDLLRQ